MGAPWPSVNADEFRTPGASRCIPVAADGYIPHHLDRFIARHRHDGGRRGSRKGWKRERKRAPRLALPELPSRRPKGSHCRLTLDAINHFTTVYAIHYLRWEPRIMLTTTLALISCTVWRMQMRACMVYMLARFLVGKFHRNWIAVSRYFIRSLDFHAIRFGLIWISIVIVFS